MQIQLIDTTREQGVLRWFGHFRRTDESKLLTDMWGIQISKKHEAKQRKMCMDEGNSQRKME